MQPTCSVLQYRTDLIPCSVVAGSRTDFSLKRGSLYLHSFDVCEKRFLNCQEPMFAAAVLPVIFSVAKFALSWLLNALFGLFCGAVVTIYGYRCWAEADHIRDDKDIKKANAELVRIHSGIGPTNRPPEENYATAAKRRGILPTEADPNNHVLEKVYAPSYATHVSSLACVATDHQQLKVINNIDIVMELTCQQLPTFGCFLKKGQTVTIPTTVNSPVTIVAQGYLQVKPSEIIVKLVLQIDIGKVSCIVIERVDGVIHMHACAD